MKTIPVSRVRRLNSAQLRPDGKYVLYWMVGSRRSHFNFALQHAVQQAREQSRPLLVLEGLRAGYRWASRRIHRFVIDGMLDNAARFERCGVRYLPYVEPEPDAGKGLLAALARHASIVVTDDFPAFFLPRMLAAAGRQLDVRLEAVDSNGLLPLSATERDFPTAYAFRRFLQKNLRDHLDAFPQRDPLARVQLPALSRLPSGISGRWPATKLESLALEDLPIDQEVAEVDLRGGPAAGSARLKRFVAEQLDRYDEDRNHPDFDATSGLSPYLHFGHVSSHDVCMALFRHEDWTPDRLSSSTAGKRAGWWGMSASSEAFLDQIVTWRELGYNMCVHRPDYDRYESLPDWARATLELHAPDRRDPTYTLDQFAAAETHDPVWNAAQRQLARDGVLHNYLRMLWGKKILEWTESPREALDVMIELNNRYALDGRNPNSYSGIFWTLGRYDRAWGPERPIFGTIRFMSSDSTIRKLKMKQYLERYGNAGTANLF